MRSRRPLSSRVCWASARPSSQGPCGVLEAGQRGGAGASVVAGDEHDIRVRLRHTGRHRAHALFGHELDVDARVRVDRLEVEDQLREVLDGVDVVVRWRGDQAHARCGDAYLGDPRVDLVRRELATLARLGALRHLDLDVGAVGQVVAGHTEAAGGNLLDRRALPVAVRLVLETGRVLAALAGVGLRTQAVHRNRQNLMGLGRDGAVGHRAGGEALHNLAGKLDLVDRDRGAIGDELHHASQGGQALGLLVDGAGVVLEDRVLSGLGRVLELEHGLRVKQVVLALAAPLILAADL